MRHLIPDDGHPHAPTVECGCGPTNRRWGKEYVLRHLEMGPLTPCQQCVESGVTTPGYHLVDAQGR